MGFWADAAPVYWLGASGLTGEPEGAAEVPLEAG